MRFVYHTLQDLLIILQQTITTRILEHGRPSLNVNPNHFTYEGILLSESISFTDSISKDTYGVNLSESVLLTDSISKTAGVNLSESVANID